MSRPLRYEEPGGLYHVLKRGDYRSWIFEEDGAKRSFKKALVDDERRARADEKLGAPSDREALELSWESDLDRLLEALGGGDAVSYPKSADWKVAAAAWLKRRRHCRNGWVSERLNRRAD